MNVAPHLIDAVKVAEDLEEIAAKHGNAEAIRQLGILWPRLDSPYPIAKPLAAWASGLSPLALRALLMDEFDRRGELYVLPSRPEVLTVYRVGDTREQAAAGLAWYRLKRHAKARADRVGASYLATALMNWADYIAVKSDRVRFLELLTLTPPRVLEIEEIGGRRHV